MFDWVLNTPVPDYQGKSIVWMTPSGQQLHEKQPNFWNLFILFHATGCFCTPQILKSQSLLFRGFQKETNDMKVVISKELPGSFVLNFNFRDHLFSACPKFSEKFRFLTPSGGKKCKFFRKFLVRTKWMILSDKIQLAKLWKHTVPKAAQKGTLTSKFY